MNEYNLASIQSSCIIPLILFSYYYTKLGRFSIFVLFYLLRKKYIRLRLMESVPYVVDNMLLGIAVARRIYQLLYILLVLQEEGNDYVFKLLIGLDTEKRREEEQ